LSLKQGDYVPMEKKGSLAAQIALVFSIMVAVLLGLATLVIGFSSSSAISDLVKAENLQIATARSAELGQLIDKARALDRRGDRFEGEQPVATMDFDHLPVTR